MLRHVSVCWTSSRMTQLHKSVLSCHPNSRETAVGAAVFLATKSIRKKMLLRPASLTKIKWQRA